MKMISLSAVSEATQQEELRGEGERRRTKPNLSSAEPFDDSHPPTTQGASPNRDRMFGGGSLGRWLGQCCRWDQLAAKRQQSSPATAGQEAEVANTHEAGW